VTQSVGVGQGRRVATEELDDVLRQARGREEGPDGVGSAVL
jgi:hypothetical protein